MQEFIDFLKQGQVITSKIQNNNYRGRILATNRSEVAAWTQYGLSLISLLAGKQSHFYTEAYQTVNMITSEPLALCQYFYQVYGICEATFKAYEAGHFKEPEYIFAAENFDDFLEHSEDFLKQNKIIEASILASVVFEDVIKKVSKKNDIETENKTSSTLILALKQKTVIDKPFARILETCADTRNDALHANWSALQQAPSRVQQLIERTRDFIAKYL